MGMLQPDRLQPGIAPLKVKKMPNVQFKTASKFPETGGKSRKKAEKTGSLRIFAERVGKIRTFSNSGPKGRGFESRHFDSAGHCESMLPGFCFSCGFSAFFRKATCRVAACRQGTDFRPPKTTSGNFRTFPHFSVLKMATLIFLVTIPDRWTICFSFVKIITEKSNG